VWAHEALRLFHDRLTDEEERGWCQQTVDEVAATHFPGLAGSDTLARPILFSKWLSKHYKSVSREDLRGFVAQRLKVFYEEELDVPLVIFDDVLEHVLRIDGVLRQPMGHLLLVGESGVGKTVLSRFVSWMNGLSIFQVRMSVQCQHPPVTQMPYPPSPSLWPCRSRPAASTRWSASMRTYVLCSSGPVPRGSASASSLTRGTYEPYLGTVTMRC
jgi:hypothetical protein